MEHGAQSGGGGDVKRRRPPLQLPTRRGDPRASVIAFGLQLLIIAIVVPSLVVPFAFELFYDDGGRAVTPERLSFITAAPPATLPSREAPRAGGDGRAPSTEPAAPAPPLIAPPGVPTGVSTVPAPARDAGAGVGPLVGGGGPTQGIRPSFTDRRLWMSPADVVEAPLVPMTRADSLQSLLHATAEAYVDSMRRMTPGGRAPGDWTFERNGRKYGIDPQFIRLGNFSIPTALLALLPMNVQANPNGIERARRLSSMRTEIMEQADRQARDDDFYAAVRALRERKERERKEAAEAKKKAEVPTPDRY